MQSIQLPKLKKINVNRPKRKKILLLSDDIRLTSGISTMSREIIMGTCHHYDWVQIGAALNHPDHGKIFDLSNEISKETGVEDPYVKIYAHTSYGNANVIREVISYENPDLLMIFTDPRHWMWFWPLEYEIHTKFKIPISYINVWDDTPAPTYNYGFYKSCDLIMNISKQTHELVKTSLGKNNWEEIKFGY